MMEVFEDKLTAFIVPTCGSEVTPYFISVKSRSLSVEVLTPGRESDCIDSVGEMSDRCVIALLHNSYAYKQKTRSINLSNVLYLQINTELPSKQHSTGNLCHGHARTVYCVAHDMDKRIDMEHTY